MTKLPAIALLVLLTACGGGGGGEASISSDERVTPAAVAEKAGCGSFQTSETEELGVSEQGRCQMDGQEVIVNTFSNNDARDNWVEIALQFGGPYAAGDRFIAYSDGSPDTTEALAEKVDAEVKR